MKLSVSNLAWPKEDNDWCLEQLVKYDIQGIELAPLKVFESWEKINEQDIENQLAKYHSLNLSVSSFQAITFGAESISLLGEEVKIDNFIAHMRKVASLLHKLNGDFAVFGSPGLRCVEDFSYEQLEKVFIKLDGVFEAENVKLALETVPVYYGCKVLSKLADTEAFISGLSAPNIVRHFDSACQYLSQDLVEDIAVGFLKKSEHLHISEVDLIDFSQPSKFNIELAPKVNSHYKGKWCVLEMSDKNYCRELFIQSIKNFKKLFAT